MSTIATQSTIRETINAAFPFSVDKLPLSGPDNMRTPHYGLFRSDDASCLPTACKTGYVPHTVDDISAIAEAAIVGFKTEHSANVQCHWNGRGHRLIIQPSNEYRRAIYGTKDNIFPRAIVRADYGRRFLADFGMFRDACNNLQMIQGVEGTSFAITHTNSLRSKMDELVADFHNLAATSDNVYEIACKLEAQQTSIVDFIAELYPDDTDSKAGRTRAVNRTGKMLRRLLRERATTGRIGHNTRVDGNSTASCWELLNMVTGYVQHDKSRNGSPSRMARALMGVDDAESVSAWNLAINLAG